MPVITLLLCALSLYLDKVAAAAVGHEPAFCLQTWGFSTTQETGLSDAAATVSAAPPESLWLCVPSTMI